MGLVICSVRLGKGKGRGDEVLFRNFSNCSCQTTKKTPAEKQKRQKRVSSSWIVMKSSLFRSSRVWASRLAMWPVFRLSFSLSSRCEVLLKLRQRCPWCVAVTLDCGWRSPWNLRTCCRMTLPGSCNSARMSYDRTWKYFFELEQSRVQV